MSPSLEQFSESLSELLMSEFTWMRRVHCVSKIDGHTLNIRVTYTPDIVLGYVNVEFTVPELGAHR